MSPYEVTLGETHPITDGDETNLRVGGYDDLGSMLMLELPDGGTRSVGKQLVEELTELEE